jgi:dTMP kinase
MRDRGWFIVLEGIDGSGKTTQLRLLASWLREQEHEVVETREPTDGVWGRRYRAWARGEFEATAREVLEFFVEDRREHVAKLIRPALERGAVVLCDRYVASTRAYQTADGVDPGLLDRSLDAAAFPEPDLTLWLRIPVSEAIARLGSDAKERYERGSFLERVDAEYARMGLEPVDACGSTGTVLARLIERVSSLTDLAGAIP